MRIRAARDPGDTAPGDTDPGDTDPGDTDPRDTDPDACGRAPREEVRGARLGSRPTGRPDRTAHTTRRRVAAGVGGANRPVMPPSHRADPRHTSPTRPH
ncbi:hypothetical protein DY245_01175 [Streptomyces inhibens]|uniref:Uncharacterized protein n=1 Tax=Streptomyces inhibens TaxID=2293571 RepID=A0A371QC54_STRIH|nr:hypothetical protein DY245_01175 [Streptomyces inhibens]